MPDAVVLAGGPPDPAIAGAMVPKAFALLAGRPMVDYVLDALRGAGPIGRVLLVGPDPLPVRLAGGVDALVAERGSLLENVAAGLEATGGGGAVLVVAADLPLLTPQAVAAFLEAAGRIEGEAWYAVVRREDVTGAFPDVRKTFVRLREGTFTGGSVVLIGPAAFRRARPAIERAMRARKRPGDLARLFGARTLLRILTRRVTIAELERRAEAIAGIRARAVLCPHPELAIDVDRRETLDVLEARFLRRPRPVPAREGEFDAL
jgi:molybdopterin-guanine dinucleotide biosynthesis protein A